MLWMPGGRIELDFLVAAVSVGGELGSRAEGAWAPDQCVFSVAFYSSVAVSVFCGPFQSLCAMTFPSASGSTAAAGDGLFRRGFLESSGCKGSRDLVVIFTFPRAFCESRVGQLSSVFLYGLLVRVRIFVRFP
jgi:hypothetical protein